MKKARFHFGARKRFQPHKAGGRKSRLTVMLGEKDGTALVAQEAAEEMKQRPGRKSPFLWKGLTLFLDNQERTSHTHNVYVEMPDIAPAE